MGSIGAERGSSGAVSRIGVVICTRNRSQSLARTLETVAAAFRSGPASCELLIVDNGSEDQTADIIAAFSGRLPVISLFEPRPGLAIARNAALAACRSDYVIWTDDDVLVPPDWICAYSDAFAAFPQAAFFGGPIEPAFDGTPPQWLRRGLGEVGSVYAHRDPARAVGRIESVRDYLPFGANFALCRSAVSGLQFDGRLGAGAGIPLGEEADFLHRLILAGHYGQWVPQAAVRHVIAGDRQTLEFLRHRFYQVGKLEGWRGRPLAPARAGRRCIVNRCKEIFFAALGNHRLRLRALKRAAMAAGAASPAAIRPEP